MKQTKSISTVKSYLNLNFAKAMKVSDGFSQWVALYTTLLKNAEIFEIHMSYRIRMRSLMF